LAGSTRPAILLANRSAKRGGNPTLCGYSAYVFA
jgi:hypothetical protein